MNVRRLVETIRRGAAANTIADENSAVVTNVGEGSSAHVSRRSHRRIVQRNGETVVDERSDTVERKGDAHDDA